MNHNYRANDELREIIRSIYTKQCIMEDKLTAALRCLETVVVAAHAVGYGAFVPRHIFDPSPKFNPHREVVTDVDCLKLYRALRRLNRRAPRVTMGAEVNYWVHVVTRLTDLANTYGD